MIRQSRLPRAARIRDAHTGKIPITDVGRYAYGRQVLADLIASAAIEQRLNQVEARLGQQNNARPHYAH